VSEHKKSVKVMDVDDCSALRTNEFILGLQYSIVEIINPNQKAKAFKVKESLNNGDDIWIANWISTKRLSANSHHIDTMQL